MSPQEAERLIQNSGTTLYLDIERLVAIENQLDFNNMEIATIITRIIYYQ